MKNKKALAIVALLVVLAVLAIIFIPKWTQKPAEDVKDAVTETVNDAKDAVEETAEKAADAVEETAEKAADAVEEAKDAVEETAEKAADAVEEAKDEAVEAVTETAEKAADAVEEAKDAVEETAEKAADAVEEAKDEAVEAVTDAVEEVKDAVDPTAKVTKIGMVTDVGGVNDKSFNQTSWEGLKALAEADSSFEVNYLESKTDADYQTNIDTFIQEDYDLIICVGYMLADATREAATNNPDQLFAIIDDSSIDLPNVACLMFAQEQASYLVGLVAGSVTESKIVGYVQGMVSDSMNLFGIGYITGVKEACPDAKVLQYNANNFGDAAGGSTAATDMITKGADVIYHAAGGTGMGVIEACNDKGIWAIGVDTDQSILAPDHVITSAMKRVDVASQDISKAVKDGSFTPGVHLYDLSNGGVDLAPTRDHIPEEVLAKVEAAKAAIIAGEKTVPTTVDACPDFELAK